MTTSIVLDASAALRVVMDASAQPALIDAIGAAAQVVAPSLMRAEVANALWKYCRTGVIGEADALERHSEALSLVQRFEDDATCYPEALRLAVLLEHPVYDALYLVTARRHAARLLTFDRRLFAQCKAAQVEARHFGA